MERTPPPLVARHDMATSGATCRGMNAIEAILTDRVWPFVHDPSICHEGLESLFRAISQTKLAPDEYEALLLVLGSLQDLLFSDDHGYQIVSLWALLLSSFPEERAPFATGVIEKVFCYGEGAAGMLRSAKHARGWVLPSDGRDFEALSTTRIESDPFARLDSMLQETPRRTVADNILLLYRLLCSFGGAGVARCILPNVDPVLAVASIPLSPKGSGKEGSVVWSDGRESLAGETRADALGNCGVEAFATLAALLDVSSNLGRFATMLVQDATQSHCLYVLTTLHADSASSAQELVQHILVATPLSDAHTAAIRFAVREHLLDVVHTALLRLSSDVCCAALQRYLVELQRWMVDCYEPKVKASRLATFHSLVGMPVQNAEPDAQVPEALQHQGKIAFAALPLAGMDSDILVNVLSYTILVSKDSNCLYSDAQRLANALSEACQLVKEFHIGEPSKEGVPPGYIEKRRDVGWGRVTYPGNVPTTGPLVVQDVLRGVAASRDECPAPTTSRILQRILYRFPSCLHQRLCAIWGGCFPPPPETTDSRVKFWAGIAEPAQAVQLKDHTQFCFMHGIRAKSYSGDLAVVEKQYIMVPTFATHLAALADALSLNERCIALVGPSSHRSSLVDCYTRITMRCKHHIVGGDRLRSYLNGFGPLPFDRSNEEALVQLPENTSAGDALRFEAKLREEGVQGTRVVVLLTVGQWTTTDATLRSELYPILCEGLKEEEEHKIVRQRAVQRTEDAGFSLMLSDCLLGFAAGYRKCLTMGVLDACRRTANVWETDRWQLHVMLDILEKVCEEYSTGGRENAESILVYELMACLEPLLIQSRGVIRHAVKSVLCKEYPHLVRRIEAESADGDPEEEEQIQRVIAVEEKKTSIVGRGLLALDEAIADKRRRFTQFMGGKGEEGEGEAERPAAVDSVHDEQQHKKGGFLERLQSKVRSLRTK